MLTSLFILFIIGPLLIIGYNFVWFLIKGKIHTNKKIFLAIEILSIIILPIYFLYTADYGLGNDCCSGSAVFSAEHSLGIYTLIIFSIIAYGFTTIRNNIYTPILELLINLFLILGLVINILLCFHLTTIEEGYLYWVFGNIPVIMLLIIQLYKNQKLLYIYISENNISYNNSIGKWSLYLLHIKPLYKYPLFIILLIPFLVLLSVFLILFGQKPDSLISAFTETYKHGFSQLDYMCDNVSCGGHFLCSVGANGHQNIVKPIRYGKRHGNLIICNRQLLVANAFEELMQERFPKIHHFIRKKYNSVGNLVHKHYHFFKLKMVSDIVYLLMKPLEWFFLFTLYLLDKKPENRIAIQYLNKNDYKLLKQKNK